MIITNNAAKSISLPYRLGTKQVQYYHFIPGHNEFKKFIWDAIQAEASKFEPEYKAKLFEPLEVVFDSDNTKDFNPMKLSQDKLEKYTENLFDEKQLEEMLSEEKMRPKPRKSVLASIQKQLTQIQTVEAKIKEARG